MLVQQKEKKKAYHELETLLHLEPRPSPLTMWRLCARVMVVAERAKTLLLHVSEEKKVWAFGLVRI